jgi:hypothetical protein
MTHVAEEDGQFREIACGAADRKQGCSQVSEDLVSLRWKIVFSDQRAVAINSGLAGDEDDATGPHVHDLRIAGRGAKLGGLRRRIGSALPSAIKHPLGIGRSQ